MHFLCKSFSKLVYCIAVNCTPACSVLIILSLYSKMRCMSPHLCKKNIEYALPASVRTAESNIAFRRQIKTLLFQASFNDN